MCDGLTGFPQATTLLGHMDSEHRGTLCADDPEDSGAITTYHCDVKYSQ